MLKKAMENDESFVLMSRLSVFDVGIINYYDEYCSTNPNTVGGSMLGIAEKKVMEYDKGFIIRIGFTVDEVADAIKAEALSASPKTSISIAPIDTDLVRVVAPLLVNSNRFRVMHLCDLGTYDVGALIYRKSKSEHVEFSEDGLFPRAGLISHVMNKVLSPVDVVKLVVANDRVFYERLFSTG